MLNKKDRLWFVDYWTNFVKTHEGWSRQQNVLMFTGKLQKRAGCKEIKGMLSEKFIKLLWEFLCMQTTIISLGGSVIAPSSVDVGFLKRFRELILSNKDRFIIVCGGGRICRDYQKAATDVIKQKQDDLDWIGVYSTKLNAQLVRAVFSDVAYEKVLEEPKKVAFDKVLIASGWKPGWSTDYIAVSLAKKYSSKMVVNITNKDYVYDKNPDTNNDAKPLEKISWKDFRKIVGDKWSPGLNVPFDPVASKEAEKSGISVVAMGKDLENLQSFLRGKAFKGTLIGNR